MFGKIALLSGRRTSGQRAHFGERRHRIARRHKISGFLRHESPIQDSLADNTLAIFEYPRTLVEISVASFQPNGGRCRRLEIVGSNGVALVQPYAPLRLLVDLKEAAGPHKAGEQFVPLAEPPSRTLITDSMPSDPVINKPQMRTRLHHRHVTAHAVRCMFRHTDRFSIAMARHTSRPIVSRVLPAHRIVRIMASKARQLPSAFLKASASSEIRRLVTHTPRRLPVDRLQVPSHAVATAAEIIERSTGPVDHLPSQLDFPAERRSAVSAARSVANLTAHPALGNPNLADARNGNRTRGMAAEASDSSRPGRNRLPHRFMERTGWQQIVTRRQVQRSCIGKVA
jgi:hypothetical protein